MNGYPFFSLCNHGADRNTFLSLPKSKLPEFSLQETGRPTTRLAFQSLEARTPAACSSAKTKRCYGLHRDCTGKRRGSHSFLVRFFFKLPRLAESPDESRHRNAD